MKVTIARLFLEKVAVHSFHVFPRMQQRLWLNGVVPLVPHPVTFCESLALLPQLSPRSRKGKVNIE
jgi:hypothetical protein